MVALLSPDNNGLAAGSGEPSLGLESDFPIPLGRTMTTSPETLQFLKLYLHPSFNPPIVFVV